jgi:L-ascorbate metabolism protein UlaG (beta-lactamase superfamily)
MKIKWFGHACFQLTTDSGITVIMDPFNKLMGYRLPEDLKADIVTTSHTHFDHNYIKAVNGDFTHLNKPVNHTIKDLKINGTLTFHNRKMRTRNIIYTFNADGLVFCHGGDLGHLLSGEQIESIGNVNVLLVNTGETGVMKVADVYKACKQINPDIIIPMHYRTKDTGFLGFVFARPEKFLNLVKDKKIHKVNELSLNSSTVKDYEGIVVMNYHSNAD